MKEKKLPVITKKKGNNKVGAPTLYKEEYCQKLKEHMESGGSFKTFCTTIGVGLQTTKDWLKVHPEFALAKEDSFLIRERKLERLIWDVASGVQRGNAQLIKFMAVNLLGWKNVKDEDEKENKKIEIKLAVDPMRDVTEISASETKEEGDKH